MTASCWMCELWTQLLGLHLRLQAFIRADFVRRWLPISTGHQSYSEFRFALSLDSTERFR